MTNHLINELEIGARVHIIYMSNDGLFSDRMIDICAVKQGYIHAYCYTRQQYRTFKLKNILAIEPFEQAKGGMHHASA